MKTNALAVANYFVELAQKDNREIRLLGLIKHVYIAHGFSLALLDAPMIDPRFDRVEAWKYGPVIPSVYHSFKHYKNTPILHKTEILEWDEKVNEPKFITPVLEDETAKKIVKTVWKRYASYSDSELVTLTHKPGSPWRWTYVEGENRIIPDNITKIYYVELFKNIVGHENWEDYKHS